MSRIFVYTGEPGGSNVVLSLLKRLQSLGQNDFNIFSRASSVDIYARAGFSCREENPLDHLEEAFKDTRLFISGASWPADIELQLWRESKKRSIASLSMLDQWMLYRERYSTGGALELKNLPDKIAVMDELAKSEMLVCGFPEEKLLITGMPYLSEIPKVSSVLNKKSTKIKLVFMSEPRKLGVNMGYDEFQIFEALLASCRRVFMDREFEICIKLHPRNQKDDFNPILAETKENVYLSQEESPRDLIHQADIVVGMSSMTLLESVLMGRATISLQIGLNREDPFVLSRMGVLPSALNEKQLDSQLKKVLCEEPIQWPGPGDHLAELDSWILGQVS